MFTISDLFSCHDTRVNISKKKMDYYFTKIEFIPTLDNSVGKSEIMRYFGWRRGLEFMKPDIFC